MATGFRPSRGTGPVNIWRRAILSASRGRQVPLQVTLGPRHHTTTTVTTIVLGICLHCPQAGNRDRLPAQIEDGALHVDGGSEFMSEFDASCTTQHIALSETPPRSPNPNR